MKVFFPGLLAAAMFFQSLFAGTDKPLHIDRVEVRTGHSIGRNNPTQPSGFQITQILPSVVIPLTETVGPEWAEGRVVWAPELFLAAASEPFVRPMLGAHPIHFRYELETQNKWQPYVLSSLGFLHANVERPETGSDFNFSLASGAGLRYRVSDSGSWIVEYRHLHISNQDIDDLNESIDAHTALVGYSFEY
jgi:opacity protein-like surface antigen